MPYEHGYVGGDVNKPKEGAPRQGKRLIFEVTPKAASTDRPQNEPPKMQPNSLPFPAATGFFPKRIRRSSAELRAMASNIRFLTPSYNRNELEM